jgi:hypothetical protein
MCDGPNLVERPQLKPWKMQALNLTFCQVNIFTDKGRLPFVILDISASKAIVEFRKAASDPITRKITPPKLHISTSIIENLGKSTGLFSINGLYSQLKPHSQDMVFRYVYPKCPLVRLVPIGYPIKADRHSNIDILGRY